MLEGIIGADGEKSVSGLDRPGKMLGTESFAGTKARTVVWDDEQLSGQIVTLLIEASPAAEGQVAAEEGGSPIRLTGPGQSHNGTYGVHVATRMSPEQRGLTGDRLGLEDRRVNAVQLESAQALFQQGQSSARLERIRRIDHICRADHPGGPPFLD